MKSKLSLLFLAFACFWIGCQEQNELNPEENKGEHVTPKSAEGNIIPNQYIIEINEDVIPSALSRLDQSTLNSREDKIAQMEVLNRTVDQELTEWMTKYQISDSEVLQRYTAAMVGLALKISPEKYEEIKANKEIKSIEHDRIDNIPEFEIERVEQNPVARAQTTTCAITNAGGTASASTAKWAWVVDSGIDLNHPDLNVITSSTFAKSFVGGSADDCNGHGTHVAGIIGAKNNSIGVVGVANNAPVVPVRVFGCSGGSPTSTIVAGINHVATYAWSGDVMNLSLGGYYGIFWCSTFSAYKSSVNAVANGGTWVAIASGNNLAKASRYQPACLNGNRIRTVTNMRCNKTYYNDPTYGGNYGIPPVDYIATGTSVYSTYKNGGYATLTGTSMATPVVAGIMHVRGNYPLSGGTVSYGGANYTIARR